YRLVVDEHVRGARAVFARFAEYRPRDAGGSGGALGFTSGPKTVHFDRVEWLTLDAFSAQAALSRGEIDWWESPPRDLADQIARDRNVTVVSHYMPAMGILRFNQLYPPFDKPEARRALLAAVDQAEAMMAVAGEDPANRFDGVGIFPTGTALHNDAGVHVLKRPRDAAAVKEALAEAGYGGEKIVVIAPTELA